jgi:hypothetical protein
VTGGRARHIGGVDVGQRGDFGRFGQRLELAAVAVFDRRVAFGDGFDQRVPSIAVRSFAQPLGAGAAAVVAGVNRFVFGHVASVGSLKLTLKPRRRAGEDGALGQQSFQDLKTNRLAILYILASL